VYKRQDIEDEIFKGLDVRIPVFKTYDLAARVAETYLVDESLRLATVSAMKEHVLANYSSEKNAERIMDLLREANR
jgi:hypothetical protein